MEQLQVQVGDMIRIQGFGYQHVGIYVGLCGLNGACVVHNCKGKGVILSTEQEFSGGKQIMMHQKATVPDHQRQQIAQRALSLLGTKYDLWNFNCEHAASYAQNGVANSPQIAGVAVLGLLTIGIAALSLLTSENA
jgi:hypothetical protein